MFSSDKKKELLDMYSKEQARRRTVKQANTKGKARLLYDAGDIDGLLALIEDDPKSDQQGDAILNES
jgi:hypothetical protein